MPYVTAGGLYASVDNGCPFLIRAGYTSGVDLNPLHLNILHNPFMQTIHS
jgi:hypothetical protein